MDFYGWGMEDMKDTKYLFSCIYYFIKKNLNLTLIAHILSNDIFIIYLLFISFYFPVSWEQCALFLAGWSVVRWGQSCGLDDKKRDWMMHSFMIIIMINIISSIIINKIISIMINIITWNKLNEQFVTKRHLWTSPVIENNLQILKSISEIWLKLFVFLSSFIIFIKIKVWKCWGSCQIRRM